MIMILGTLLYNDDISMCFFHCFEIFTVWAASKVKGQEIAQNEKQLHPSRAISQEQYRI